MRTSFTQSTPEQRSRQRGVLQPKDFNVKSSAGTPRISGTPRLNPERRVGSRRLEASEKTRQANLLARYWQQPPTP